MSFGKLSNRFSLTRMNCDIDRLIVDDKEVTGHKDIADAMNSYFTSIASSLLANSNEIESEFAPDEAPLNIEPFTFYTIRNVNEVSKAIEDLNQAIKSAAGSDGIPVRALKMTAPNIYRSLTHLFNESLSTGKFPSAWKITKVTPLFKGGTTTDCNNYRPISVLPCISKILGSFCRYRSTNYVSLRKTKGIKYRKQNISKLILSNPKYKAFRYLQQDPHYTQTRLRYIQLSSKNMIDLAVYNVNKDLQNARHCKNGLIYNIKKSEATIDYGDSILKQQGHFKYLVVVVEESLL